MKSRLIGVALAAGHAIGASSNANAIVIGFGPGTTNVDGGTVIFNLAVSTAISGPGTYTAGLDSLISCNGKSQ